MEAIKQAVGRFEAVPQQLRDRPRWLLWKQETRGGKPTKIPKQPSGQNASVTDESTWSTFEEVCAALDKNPSSFSGIGFVLNGDGIVGIDYDKCIVEGGEISAEVLEAIEEFKSYTEISPSETGLHTFVIGQLPEQSNNRKGKFEVYETGRFFTVTGEHYWPSPLTIEARQEQLEVFVDKHLGTKGQGKVVPLSPTKPANNSRVAEIIEAASKGVGRKKFARLFTQGDFTGYPSASEAVQGLLCILRHYTQDPSELDAVFRSSELYKQHWSHKWDRLSANEIAKVLDGFSPDEQQQSNKRQKNATFEDVCKLIEDTFPDKKPRKDIVSEDLFVWRGKWINVLHNEIKGTIESHMRHSGGFFQPTTLLSDIFRYTASKVPTLLIDIPEWDGRDRISECAAACNVTNVEPEQFEELLKEWGSVIFLKAENPFMQNTCLILVGRQGVGKDTWINNLVDGLTPQYATIPSFDKWRDDKNKIIMASSLVLKIPEFERAVSRLGVDELKNSITSPTTTCFKPYGRVPETMQMRASWCGSANDTRFFVDPTGNRRFLVFELGGDVGTAIKRNYPEGEEHQLQILAQFRRLAQDGYKASESAWERMTEYLKVMTPENPCKNMLADFDALIDDHLLSTKSTTMFLTVAELYRSGILEQLASNYEMKIPAIKRELKKSGRTKQFGKLRTWGYFAKGKRLTLGGEANKENEFEH